METLKDVQKFVDAQLKVLEGKKNLLTSLENLYEALSCLESLAGYTIEINPNTINNFYGYVEISKNNLTRCKIEVTRDKDVGISFPFSKAKRKWINCQGKFIATPAVLQIILEGLK